MKSQFEILLEQWINNKTITKKAAAKMKSDWKKYSANQSGSRWTIAVSFIGALLLGIAAIAFMSTNWQELSRGGKLFLAFFATFSAFGSGFFLSEIQKTYQKTGKALLFLSCLLFGGSLALISQIYHLSGDPWQLLALWTVGILPVAYVFHIAAVLRLALTTGIIAILLFLAGASGIGIEDVAQSIFESFGQFATLLLIATLLFAIGSIHLLKNSHNDFGKIFRLLGIKLFLFFLFWFTFYDIAKEIVTFSTENIVNTDAHFWKNIVLAIVSSGLMTLAYSKSKNKIEEIGFSAAMLLALLFLFGIHFFAESSFFWILAVLLANLFFLFAVGLLLREGYRQENLQVVNFTTFAIGAFLFGKYIDLFAGTINTTLFFFLGGIILIAGGVFLEKKRRSLTKKFAK